MVKPLDIVILAAGQGTRMQSRQAKVLHPLAGKPLLAHVINTAEQLAAARIHVVIGHDADAVSAAIADDAINWVIQEQQLGTGHAVQQLAGTLDPSGITLVLYGDVPLTAAATLQSLVACVAEDAMGLLTVALQDPTGYGRILRGDDGSVLAIIEQRDASQQELDIREGNTGIMALPTAGLLDWLQRLGNNNAQGEYYLTDVIAMAVADGVRVITHLADNEKEVAGINSRAQLAALERHLQLMQAERLMAEGVSFADPQRFDLRGRLQHDGDVYIDVNVVLEGEVCLGSGVMIGPGCVIRNAQIDEGSVLLAHSVIDGAVVGKSCNIGPFARLRPGTCLADGAKVGNFVETKKTQIGAGSKVSHLSYIGDATVGEQVNIGAGTITCNYDGVNKHHTRIGDSAFIGSNTALVAPVDVGAGATVAAGSVITSQVPDENLAVARGKQRNIAGWQRPTRKPSR